MNPKNKLPKHEMNNEDAPSADGEAQKARPVLTRERFPSVIEQIIGEAQLRGDFDNLRGHGKPLQLEEDAYAGDNALAYKLLKDNNFTLPWIADRKEIMAEIEVFRTQWTRAWRLRGPELRALVNNGQDSMAKRRCRAVVEGFSAEIVDLNLRIQSANNQIPVLKLALIKLKPAYELKRTAPDYAPLITQLTGIT